MEAKIRKHETAFMAKGENPERALVLAQTRYLTDEFQALKNEIAYIKKVLISSYAEAALKTMNNEE